MVLTKSKRIIFSLVGIFLIAVGVAFNAGAFFGNDPICILYDGLRNTMGLAPVKLGFVSNIVNYSVIVIVFFIGKRYISWGTLIYILPYGTFVSIGTYLYETVFSQEIFISRLIATVLGCTMIYIGVGTFITMDIGLDPFTGLVMAINDKLKWNFRRTKMCFDACMIIIGTVLGGKLGVITIITALTGGPCIQASVDFLKRFVKEA